MGGGLGVCLKSISESINAQKNAPVSRGVFFICELEAIA
jgi:hypothetical protein